MSTSMLCMCFQDNVFKFLIQNNIYQRRHTVNNHTHCPTKELQLRVYLRPGPKANHPLALWVGSIYIYNGSLVGGGGSREEELVKEHILLDTTMRTERLEQYGGNQLPETMQKAIAAASTRIMSNPPNILLASLPKSGTTWLKALAFATVNRATHSPSDTQHPLRHHSPHDCVSYLELMLIKDDDDALSSPPCLVATHIPYSLLPDTIKAEGSGCRLVYVCRDLKDVLVSFWNFYNKERATLATGGKSDSWVREVEATGLAKFEDAYELFCEGRYLIGTPWLHILEFWHESQRRPNEVLFLRYEDMLGDTVGNLKKLAAFLGCPFSNEEEETGVVEQIVELCSLESLKSMDVNKIGSTVRGIKNERFFRKGQVGDWKNYMTLEMAARLDKIVEEATRGSGLTFAGSVSL